MAQAFRTEIMEEGEEEIVSRKVSLLEVSFLREQITSSSLAEVCLLF